MVSVYSVISSIIFYNLGLLILFALRRRTDFMAQYGISTLLFLVLLSLVRLITPVDIAAAHIVRSEIIIPGIIEFLGSKPGFIPLSLGEILLVIWAAGFVAYGFKGIRREYISYKARRRYPRIKSEQLARVSKAFDRKLNIRLSPLVCQPYTAGIIKPEIYLPFIPYSDEELYFVLLHELQHIKSRDNLKRLIFLILEAVFWWNPLAHKAVDEFEALVEFQCDAKLSGSMDSDTLKNYLQTLVAIVKRLDPEGEKNSKLALSFAQTDVIQRFEVLLRRRDKKPRHVRYIVWSLILLIFFMSYFVIIQPYFIPPDVSTEVENEMIVTAESSYILFDGETYYLIYNGTTVEEVTEEILNKPPYDNLKIIGG